MRKMRPAALASVLVLLLAGAATAGGPHAPVGVSRHCKAGSVSATVAGKHVCLKAGARCTRGQDRTYHRYRFHCHSGRLTRFPAPARRRRHRRRRPCSRNRRRPEGSSLTSAATASTSSAWARVRRRWSSSRAPWRRASVRAKPSSRSAPSTGSARTTARERWCRSRAPAIRGRSPFRRRRRRSRASCARCSRMRRFPGPTCSPARRSAGC